MPEEDEQASEVYEAKEVFDLHFPSGDQPAEVLHPGEEPFDFPAALVAPECGGLDLLRLGFAPCKTAPGDGALHVIIRNDVT
jgi:hypothetical protein